MKNSLERVNGFIEKADALSEAATNLADIDLDSLNSGISQIGKIDFDRLNKAIKDLSDVIEPLARFASRFS